MTALLRIILLYIIFNVYTNAFVNLIPQISQKYSIIPKKLYEENITPNCNEKTIYRNYLIGLRKIRKTLKTTNIGNMVSIVNFTNTFVSNITWVANNTEINNEIVRAKQITISNINIDVSNVKYIQISTKNDTLVVELDKKNKLSENILSDISNIDALINILSILTKVVNIN